MAMEIMDLPIGSMVIFHCYVKLPEVNITKNKVGAQAKLVIKAAGKTRGFTTKRGFHHSKGVYQKEVHQKDTSTKSTKFKKLFWCQRQWDCCFPTMTSTIQHLISLLKMCEIWSIYDFAGKVQSFGCSTSVAVSPTVEPSISESFNCHVYPPVIQHS